MFLNVTQHNNMNLIESAVKLHQSGEILPDTYVIDLDQLLFNAQLLLDHSNTLNIKLYAMTKQIGRNPFIAKKLIDLGFPGVVVVDFKEAEIMIDAGVKIGNVGHLVQIPKAMLTKVLLSDPEIVTTYSVEKAIEINEIAYKLNKKQDIMLRVLEEHSPIYSGQQGGFYLDALEKEIVQLEQLKNINIKGVTAFPCFLYDHKSAQLEPSSNIETINKAANLLKNLKHDIQQLNMPSATSMANLDALAQHGGTHGEPGHALTGTTPYNAQHKEKNEEKVAMIYVSEVSHNINNKGICFGGGHYRRSGMVNALVGQQFETMRDYKIAAPTMESIDYHFELDRPAAVGSTVLAAFRTQIFVTRSDVAIVEGISKSNPKVLAIYDPLGRQKR